MMRRVIVNDNKALGGTLIEDELVKSDLDIEIDTVNVDTVAELVDTLEDPDALVAAAGIPITAEVIEATDSFSAVGRVGIGCDNVDFEAALEHNVTVMNVLSYAIEKVSSHALALTTTSLDSIEPSEQYRSRRRK